MQPAKYADAQTESRVISVYCLSETLATLCRRVQAVEPASRQPGQTKSGSWLSLNYTMPAAKLRYETYT